MKKLIKCSTDFYHNEVAHYYVIDDEAEVQPETTWCINEHERTLRKANKESVENTGYWHKIVATTNFLLPLPQITNASDDMVGKEVEVVNPISWEDGITVEIKPISKEIKPCATCANKPHCDVYGMLCSSIHSDEFWIPKEISTNETLEEVAEKELKPMLCGNWNHNCFNNENLIDVWVAGYKHCESKMYSHSEMKQLITNAFVEMSDWKNEGKETRELEVLMEQWFNNNKK